MTRHRGHGLKSPKLLEFLLLLPGIRLPSGKYRRACAAFVIRRYAGDDHGSSPHVAGRTP